MTPWLLAGYLAACSGDATTTTVALQRGAREVVLTQHIQVNAGIVAGQTAVTVVALRRLERTHPKLAKVILISGIAWRGYVVAHNLRTIRRLR